MLVPSQTPNTKNENTRYQWVSKTQTRIQETTPKQMHLLQQDVHSIRRVPSMVLPWLDTGTIGKPITNQIKNHHRSCYENTEPETQPKETNTAKYNLYNMLRILSARISLFTTNYKCWGFFPRNISNIYAHLIFINPITHPNKAWYTCIFRYANRSHML